MANKQIAINLMILADTKQAESSFLKLKTSLTGLTSNVNFGQGVSTFKQLLDSATGSISKVKALLQLATNESGLLNMGQFVNSMKKAGITVEQLRKDCLALGPVGEQAFKQFSSTILNTQMQVKRTASVVDKLWGTLKNVASWYLTSNLLYGFMNGIRNAYQYVQDLNASLNNIRIVTGYSTDEMAKFAELANKAAKALSTSTLEYTKATQIYFQLGLTGKEVTDRAAVTLKLANVTKTSGEEASEWMTAIWNNFYDGSKSLEYYADVLTKLGAATASSSDEIAGGLEKFSAVADTINLSYEYAAAALATITAETRQSEDVVGTALKTLFARMEGLKLGETLDDGTTLNQYSEAMFKVGINIKDANGNLKDMDSILDEMGNKWDTLSKAQQVALAQSVGGIRQYNQIIALMDNWDVFERNVSMAKNSTGTLDELNQIYAESWEAANKRVKASAEGIYQDLLKDDAFITLTDGFASFLEVINQVIDAMGGMKGMLPGLLLLITKLFGPKIIAATSNFNTLLQAVSASAQQLTTETRIKTLLQELIMMQSKNPGITKTFAYEDKRIALESEEQILLKVLKLEGAITQEQLESLNMAQERLKTADQMAIAKAKELDAARRNQSGDIIKSTLAGEEANIKGKTYVNSKGKTVQADAKGWKGRATATINQGLAMRNEDMTVSKEGVDKITTAFLRMGYAEDEARLKATNLIKTIDGIDNQNLDDLINVGGEVGRLAQELKEAREEAERLRRQLNKGLDTGIYDQAGLGLIKFASAAMSVAMAFLAISSIKDVITNEDMSTWEKVTLIMMSLSMILMMVGPLIALIGDETKKASIASGANAVALLFEAAATKLSGKSKGKAAAETTAHKTATDADTASVWANIAASLAHLALALLPYLAIAALVTFAIYSMIKARNAETDKLKELQKKQEEYNAILEEAKSKHDEFVSGLSNYQLGIEGLKELTRGTLEYTEAVMKANEEARALMEQSDYLKNNYTLSADGVITFSEEDLEEARRLELLQLAIAQNMALQADMNVAKQLLVVDQLNVLRSDDFNVGNNIDPNGVETASIIGGVAAATTAALAVGLTDVWNPVGWASLIVGGLGAAIFGIASAVQNDATEAEQEMLQLLQDEVAAGNLSASADSEEIKETLTKSGAFSPEDIKAFVGANGENVDAINELILSNEQLRISNLKLGEQMALNALQGNKYYEKSEYKEGILAVEGEKRDEKILKQTEIEFEALKKKYTQGEYDSDDDELKKEFDKLFKEEGYVLTDLGGTEFSIKNKDGNYVFADGDDVTWTKVWEIMSDKLAELWYAEEGITYEDIKQTEQKSKKVIENIALLTDLSSESIKAVYGQFVSNKGATDVSMLSLNEIDRLKEAGFNISDVVLDNYKLDLQDILDEFDNSYAKNLYNRYIDLDSFNIEELTKISDLLDNSTSKYGTFIGDNLATLLKMAGDTAPEVVDKINSIDLASTSVSEATAIMGDSIIGSEAAWLKYIVTAHKAAVMQEAGAALTDKLAKKIKDLKEVLTDDFNIGDIIKEEDYKKIIALNETLADSFIKVYDGYMLVSSAELIQKTIDDLIGATLTENVEAVKTLYAMINKNQDAFKDFDILKETKLGRTEAIDKIFKQLSVEDQELLLTRAGVGSDWASTDESTDALYNVIKQYADSVKKGTFNEKQYQELVDAYGVTASALNIDTYEEYAALLSEATQNNINESDSLAYLNGVLRKNLDLTEQETEAYKIFISTSKNLSPTLNKTSREFENIALQSASVTKGFTSLAENWKTISENFNYGLGSELYNEAITALEDYGKLILGANDLSNAFLHNNIDIFKAIGEGTGNAEELYYLLQLRYVEYLISQLNLSSLQVSTVNNVLTSLQIAELLIGQTLSEVDADLTNNLLTWLNKAQISAEQIATIAAALNYGLVYDENGQIKDFVRRFDSGLINFNAYQQALNKANSGSKKEAEEFDEKRYHEIDEVLDDISKKLDIISTKKDKAFGADKIHYMDQELKLLQADLDATEVKLEQAKSYYETDKAAIMKYGVQLDSEGRITNYDEVRQHYYELYVSNPEKYEESWKKFNEDLDQYEKTLNTVQDLEKDLLDKWYAMKEAALEKIEYTVEFKVEASEDTLKLLDLMLKRLDDSAYDAAKAIDVLGQKTQTTLNDIDTYNKGIVDILKGADFTDEEIKRFFAGDKTVFEGKTLTEAEVDKLREYRDNLIEAEDTLIELRDTVFETALNSFNAWNEKLNENADKLERCNTLLEAHRNIIDVVGKSYLGVDNKLLGSIAEARTDIALGSVQAATATFKANQATLEEAKANLEKAKIEGDEESIKKWEDFVKEIEATTNESEEQMMSKLTEAMELAGEIFEETVERAMETLNEALGNIEKLQDKFDKQRQLEELYLADHKKLYEINKLNRDIQNSIDQTDNVKAQRELAAIAQEVMAYQADGAQMSKYDLEYLQKRYELKKAEIALEEALNAKNQVKLQRDAKGNWGYIYTADLKNIDKAQSDYDKSLYELREFEYSSQRDLTEKWLDLNQLMMDELAELRASDFANAQEYEAKRQEIIAHYTQMANGVLYEIKDLTYQSSIVNREYNLEMADTFEETLLGRMYPTYTSFEELSTSVGSAIDTAMVALGSAYTTWSLTVDGAFEAAGIDAKTYADYMAQTFVPSIQKSVSDTVKEAETLANKMKEYLLGTDGKGGAIGAVADFETKFAGHMENVRIANELTVTSMDGVSRAATKMAEDMENSASRAESAATRINLASSSIGGDSSGIDEDSSYIPPGDDGNENNDDEEITALPDGSRKSMGGGRTIKGSDVKADSTGILDPNTRYVPFKNTDGTISYYKTSDVKVVDGETDIFRFRDGATAAFTTTLKDTSVKLYKPLKAVYGLSDHEVYFSVDGLAGWYNYDKLSYEDLKKLLSKGLSENKLNEIKMKAGISGSVDVKSRVWDKIKYKSGTNTYNIIGDKAIRRPLGFLSDYSHDFETRITDIAYKSGLAMYKISYPNSDDSFWIKASDAIPVDIDEILSTYDTGGYTGSWGSDGRLAMLHQKEIVLNAHDTENFLAAVKIVRSMSDMLEHNAAIASRGLQIENRLANTLAPKQLIEQNVKIEASFPNATDRYEIEQAFNSLINDATQYVNRN